MKKILILLICSALILQLCGCLQIIDNGGSLPDTPNETTSNSPVETTASQETTVPAETQASVQQPPMLSLSLPSVTEEEYAEDGTLLFSHTYPSPVFHFDDTSVAHVVLLDLLNHIDASNGEVTRLREAAKEYYDPTVNWLPYFVNVTYRVKRIDQNALSLLGAHVSYHGAVHPAYIPTSVTYDLVTGNCLALQDILTDDYSSDTLLTLVLDALSPMEDELYGDYAQIVTDLFSDLWLDNDDWYLSDTGLCFYFAPYDIAPFASGTIVAEIPYEELTSILLPSYFPPESVPANGDVQAVLFSQADSSRYSRFSEVILEPEGEQILLYTGGTVSDIRISQGVWNEDGTAFYADSIVFAANRLTGQDAILLQTYIPDTMPNLQLQYTSNGTVITVYISQSGKDGSIILMGS